jgi:hypothetical protein
MITQDLRVWLEMEIPVVEDGNSFGTSCVVVQTLAADEGQAPRFRRI